MKDRSKILNIASFSTQTRALGPGLRAVVWVQGCPFHCRGCIAPEWISFQPAMQITPRELVDRLLVADISGLTFSGGEPMEQAAGLAEVARLVKDRREVDIISFTGHRYEQLLRNPPNPGVPELLAQVDVLIDGPFIQALNDGVGLRGSANQRVIHLTSKLKGHDLESCTRNLEITVTNGELALIGIPTPGIVSAMGRAAFADYGKEGIG